MPFDPAGHINLGDVTVDSGVLIVALVNDSRTKRVANLGIAAGQCVIQADPERYLIRDTEAWVDPRKGEEVIMASATSTTNPAAEPAVPSLSQRLPISASFIFPPVGP